MSIRYAKGAFITKMDNWTFKDQVFWTESLFGLRNPPLGYASIAWTINITIVAKLK